MAKKIMSFDDVVGHQNIVDRLKRCLANDNVPNVQIFHGKPGLGKTTCAKLVAVGITTMHENEQKRSDYIKSVIVEEKSTDSIKLFNMSNLRDDSEIQNVKSELNVGFSSTGRKVLILDEAHGMTKEAQDAILTELESLPEQVYVIFCTTEIGEFRKSLLSRSKATFRFGDLTFAETKRLIREEILYRQLQFDMTTEVVIAMIASWCNNQPRMAYNLLENFQSGSIVTTKDIETFIDTNSVPSIIELLKYLYGSLTLGMDYLTNSLKYDTDFADVLIEVCKVAMGHTSPRISKSDTLFIKNFMEDRPSNNIVKFTAEVAGLEYVSKRRVVSAFMRSHISYSQTPPTADKSSIRTEDMKTLSINAGVMLEASPQVREVKQGIPSLAGLLGDSASFGE